MRFGLEGIDHNSKVRGCTLRILSVFHEKKSHDRLGLRSVRDGFVDQSFREAVSIQTRLRRKSRVAMA